MVQKGPKTQIKVKCTRDVFSNFVELIIDFSWQVVKTFSKLEGHYQKLTFDKFITTFSFVWVFFKLSADRKLQQNFIKNQFSRVPSLSEKHSLLWHQTPMINIVFFHENITPKAINKNTFFTIMYFAFTDWYFLKVKGIWQQKIALLSFLNDLIYGIIYLLSILSWMEATCLSAV